LRQIPQSRGQQLLGGTPCAFNPAEVRIACFLVHLIDQASKCISARHVILIFDEQVPKADDALVAAPNTVTDSGKNCVSKRIRLFARSSSASFFS